MNEYVYSLARAASAAFEMVLRYKEYAHDSCFSNGELTLNHQIEN